MACCCMVCHSMSPAPNVKLAAVGVPAELLRRTRDRDRDRRPADTSLCDRCERLLGERLWRLVDRRRFRSPMRRWLRLAVLSLDVD